MKANSLWMHYDDFHYLSDFMSDYDNDEDISESDLDDDCSGSDSDSYSEVFGQKSQFILAQQHLGIMLYLAAIAMQLTQNVSIAGANNKT